MFPHILIVDDEPSICAMISATLRPHEYRVSVANNTSEARRIMSTERVDLILLDWKLHDESGRPHPEDGFGFLKALRQTGDSTAVIMITTNVGYGESTIVLETGADDYVRKPFDQADLLARIKAVLRRGSRNSRGAITFEGWVFNLATHKLFSQDGIEVRLRASESLLLSVLATRPQQILDRRTLTQYVFGSEIESGDRGIDNLVVDLRRKLPDDVIKAIRGRGYMFAAPVTEHSSYKEGARR